jgi:hypothetical protein
MRFRAGPSFVVSEDNAPGTSSEALALREDTTQFAVEAVFLVHGVTLDEEDRANARCASPPRAGMRPGSQPAGEGWLAVTCTVPRRARRQGQRTPASPSRSRPAAVFEP